MARAEKKADLNYLFNALLKILLTIKNYGGETDGSKDEIKKNGTEKVSFL